MTGKPMDYTTDRKFYYTDPAPEPRYAYAGILGMTLYYADYEEALGYYSRVLGPPAYVEGDDTRGWRIGETWLTLLKSPSGNPQNSELTIVMQTPEEAERLHAAFLEAGGKGDPP